MKNLDTLHDAFETLEQRADDALHSAGDYAFARHQTRRRGSVRYLAPAAAAALVLAGGGGVAIWQTSSDGPSSQSAAGASRTASPSPSQPAPEPSSSSANEHYVPPQTAGELTAKARTILADIATIDIATISVVQDPEQSGPPQRVVIAPDGSTPTPAAPAPDPSSPPMSEADAGAGIHGTLTADGRSGGFLLDVYATTPPLNAACSGDVGNDCTVVRNGDGSSLAVGSWQDRSVPGGLSYEVQYVRPDGATILLILSTEADPKGDSNVTTDRLPLTKQQMTSFASDPRW